MTKGERFIYDMGRADFGVAILPEHRGRYGYVGPAAVIDAADLGKATRLSLVVLQWEKMDDGSLIVYPAG